MKRVLIAATMALLSAPVLAGGINLDHPRLIDAATIILMPGVMQNQLDRKSDTTVRAELPKMTLELRQVQSKPCVFQTVVIGKDERVSEQFDFSRAYSDYEIGPSNIAPQRVRLSGDNMYCQKTDSGATCRNFHDIPSWGVGQTQRIVRALGFIFENGCPALERQGLR